MIKGILLLTLYFLICVACYYSVRIQYKHYRSSLTLSVPKIKSSTIIIFSVVFSIYNMICTTASGYVLGSDRYNYSIEFSGIRSANSIGLEFVFSIVKFFKGDIFVVFYITTFISVFIVFIAYKKSRIAPPEVLLLLFLTDYIFFTFTSLKQCYTASLACLFFVLVLEYSSFESDISAIIIALIATLFHSSGFVLFPLFIMIKMVRKKPLYAYLFFLFSLLFVIFLPHLMNFLALRVGGIFPVLVYKIQKYFSEETVSNSSRASFLKYSSFYYITIIGFIWRNKGVKKTVGYDAYLSVSLFASLVIAYSMNIYWFSRFIYIFCFPCFVFYKRIRDNDPIVSNRQINDIIVCGMLCIVTVRKIMMIFIRYGAF